ncbi:relaxase domain-containing protein [Klebsiella pneumoniae]|nr:relaxase domain-containing protein [Klebsiella pneumoniae]
MPTTGAVTEAVRQLETLAATRVMTDGKSETVLTGNLIVAKFNHDTNRNRGTSDTHPCRRH